MQEDQKAIIQNCVRGNEQAQMQLYNLYCDAMFNIVCRYIKNTEDAKDVMQDGFLKAFSNIKKYKPEYSFGSWLKRIIINQCIDALRKQKGEFTAIDYDNIEVIDDGNWSFNIYISKEAIITAIKQLSKKHQLVVSLYLIEGYDHGEISQILGIPVKTSRTHLRRGRLQLKELLKTKYDEARY